MFLETGYMYPSTVRKDAMNLMDIALEIITRPVEDGGLGATEIEESQS